LVINIETEICLVFQDSQDFCHLEIIF